MRVSQMAIGQRLRTAREQRGITQGSAAKAAAVPRTAIGLMEAGRRRVSTMELVHLAELYGKPVEWFVRSGPNIDDDASTALFRAEPCLRQETYAREASRCIQVFQHGASLVALIGRRPEVLVPRYELPTPRWAGQAVRQGRKIASSERRRLGLGVAPLASLPELLRSQGVWVAALAMPDQISGLCLTSPEFGVGVAVNKEQAPVRCRFSLAHEYGHVAMDRNRAARVTRGDRDKDPTEQRANSFAASFLMPAGGVWEFLDGIGKGRGTRDRERLESAAGSRVLRVEQRAPRRLQRLTYADLALLGHEFGVSYEAALWRVRSLNIINGDEAEDLLRWTDTARSYIKQALPGGWGSGRRDSSAEHELAWQVLPLAIEALHRGAIELRKLVEIGRLLRIDEGEILKYAAAVGSD